MTVQVRKARREDAPALFEVNVRSIREVCSRDYAPHQIEFWTRNKHPEGFEAFLCDETKQLFAGLHQGEIAGVGMIDPTAGRILLLYVVPEALGQGLGKALLLAMEAELHAAGIRVVKLDSTLTALPFYEHQGYANLGRYEVLGTLPSFRMEKRLG